MHTSPPPPIRCHRCGQVNRGNMGGYYIDCGHADKLADLTVAQTRPVQDDLARLMAAVSPESIDIEAATATADQFQDDLRRGLRILAGLLDE